ncbi:MAG: calcium-binding protein [Phenylobacterium sp.]
MVTWRTADEDPNIGLEVRGQVFNASGAKVGGQLGINTHHPDAQVSPALTALKGGGFVATWADSFSDDDGHAGSEIKAQLFDAAGGKVGGEFQVNKAAAGFQTAPAVSPLDNGGFVAFYGSEDELRGQMFDIAGKRDGSEIRIETKGGGEQMNPHVASLAGGGFVVVWVEDFDSEPTGQGQVHAQVFDADGDTVGKQIEVDAPGAFERDPAITALPDGGFVLGFTSGPEFPWEANGVWLQQFDHFGKALGGPLAVGATPDRIHFELDLTTLADGDVVASWRDGTEDGTLNQVYDQRFDVVGAARGLEIDGGSGADTLGGSSGGDVIDARSGDDSVLGLGGNDEISGGSGRDSLDGGAGNDTLEGGSSADWLRGGAGNDWLEGDSGADRFVFGPDSAAADRDIVADFGADDRIALVGGLTLSSFSYADVTGDGHLDTLLNISNGSHVVLSDFHDWKAGLLI